MLLRLHEHEDEYLCFMTDPNVPFHTAQAESAVQVVERDVLAPLTTGAPTRHNTATGRGLVQCGRSPPAV